MDAYLIIWVTLKYFEEQHKNIWWLKNPQYWDNLPYSDEFSIELLGPVILYKTVSMNK